MPYDFSLKTPVRHADTFVAEGAQIIGAVTLKAGASVWYNSVLRADVADIVIGEDSNIQDNCTVHVDFGRGTVLGDRVTVGHGAILHACTIEDDCIIGMGAIVLDGAVIKKGTIVAAGALVPPRKTYPAGSLVLGSPAVVVRALSEEEVRHNGDHARSYVEFWKAYLAKGIGKEVVNPSGAR
ncbi:MAG: gamma carbonic anhydrase family protein [Candidatus Aminicenantes bacterium]|nr:gamma carbonic anhydrase family protein [Candidatus Aminicenantes bacterium]